MKLANNTCFAMELAVIDTIAEWDNEPVFCPTVQIVQFAEDGGKPVDGIQKRFHLL